MHIPSFICLFTSIIALCGTTFSAPLQYVNHPLIPTTTDVVEKRQLQVLVEVSAILQAAQTVVNDIINIIDEIDGDIAEAEGQYTQGIVTNMMAQYPTMNVLVFHDQKSGYGLYGATHAHVEFDIALGFTKGYEIWVFDYGTFSLAGDGGYDNWAIGGDFSGPSDNVVFTSMNGN